MTEPDRPTLADRHPPRWRLIYLVAYGSLVPLAALALLLWWPQAPARAALGLALTSYSAMLASFIGGFHWGIGLRYMATTSEMPTFHFVWGPVPAYLAWGAFLLQPPLSLVSHSRPRTRPSRPSVAIAFSRGRRWPMRRSSSGNVRRAVLDLA